MRQRTLTYLALLSSFLLLGLSQPGCFLRGAPKKTTNRSTTKKNKSPAERFAEAIRLFTSSGGERGGSSLEALCAEGHESYCVAAAKAASTMAPAQSATFVQVGCTAHIPPLCAQIADGTAQGVPLPAGILREFRNTPSSDRAALSHALLLMGDNQPGRARDLLFSRCKNNIKSDVCQMRMWLLATHPQSHMDLMELTGKGVCAAFGKKVCGPAVAPLEKFQRDLAASVKQCRGGDTSSCVQVGNVLSSVQPGIAPFGGGTIFPPEAMRVMEQALLDRLIVLPSPPHEGEIPGSRWYEKACLAKNPEGCIGRWFLAKVGRGADLSRWADAWRAISQGECARGVYTSCFVHPIEEKFHGGKGLPRRDKFIYKKLSTAVLGRCTKNDVHGFDALARWFTLLHIEKKPSTTIRKMLKKGCEEGSLAACIQYGKLLEYVGTIYKSNVGRGNRYKSKRRLRLAAWAYSRSCKRGHWWSCYQLAFLYLNGFGVKKDLKRSNDLIERAGKELALACDTRSGEACYELTRMRGALSPKMVTRVLRKGCKKGSLSACMEALRGRPMPKLRERLYVIARDLASVRCHTGVSSACVSAGALALLRLGVPDGARESAPWFERGCFMKDPGACWLAAYMHEINAARASDLGRAALTLRLGCSLNRTLPCEHLSALQGRAERAQKSVASCERGEAPGCLNAARALQSGKLAHRKDGFKEVWQLLFPGVERPKTAKRQTFESTRAMFTYASTACDKDVSGGCILAHTLMERTPRLGPDAKMEKLGGRVNTLLDKECRAKVADSCRDLALYCLQKKLGCTEPERVRLYTDKAFALYKAQCDAKDAQGCYKAAQILDQTDPEAKSMDKVLTYMARACTGKVVKGCSFLGLYWFTRSKSEKGGKYLGRACKLGDVDSCYKAGRFYERRGNDKEIRKAKFYYLKACQKKHRKACFNLKQL